MKNEYRLIILIVACGLSRAAVAETIAIDPRNPPMGLFSDEWAEVFFGGKKVGYTHSSMTRKADLIYSANEMKMDLGRADFPVTMSLSEFNTETLQGEPVSFELAQELSMMRVTMKGTFKDGVVTIVTSQYEMEQKQDFEYPEGSVLKTWGAFRETLLRGFAPGTHYGLKVYEPLIRMDTAINASTTIGDWEEFDCRGEKRRGFKSESVMQSPIGEMKTTAWLNKNGIPIKAMVPIPGFGDLEVISSSQEAALADFVPPEFFLTTVVPANRAIDVKQARRIRFLVTPKTSEIDLGTIPSTGPQTARRTENGAWEVVVTRQVHKPVDGVRSALSSTSRADYLEGNLMMNIADPKLIDLAKRAAGGEKEPFALADRLRKFVTDYVVTKSLNVGFATASEVARTREGDCSEHGVLLAALGRLNGLPSRVVVGLAYVPKLGAKTDVFGYHMWTEFLIDGRWIGFDAALRESECNPARIAFATSSLRNSGLADLSLPLLPKIGGINIEILEIEAVGPGPRGD